MSDSLEDLARRTICPRCEAGVGEPCRTIAGAATDTHTGRLDQLREAYGRGYEQAQADLEPAEGDDRG